MTEKKEFKKWMGASIKCKDMSKLFKNPFLSKTKNQAQTCSKKFVQNGIVKKKSKIFLYR